MRNRKISRAAVAAAVLAGSVFLVAPAEATQTYTVACTARATLSSPVTNTAYCHTAPVRFASGKVLATARVRVDGIGLVGAQVRIQSGSSGAYSDTGPTRTCGPTVGSCVAATSVYQNLEWPSDYAVRAFCAWNGSVATNVSIPCEMTLTLS